MRVRAMVAALAALALLAPRVRAGAQRTTILVEVADEATGRPLHTAEVSLPELARVGRADPLGVTRFPRVPAGIVHVHARMIGYDPIEAPVFVANEDTTEVVLLMKQHIATLATVTVRSSATAAQMEEFERHRERGIGHFLTDSVFDQSQGIRLERTLASRLPGLLVLYNQDEHVYMLATNRGAELRNPHWLAPGETEGPLMPHGPPAKGKDVKPPVAPGSATQDTIGGEWHYANKPCWVDVYVNGVRQSVPDFDLLSQLRIAGVEFYTQAEAPVELRRSGAECGLVMIWTKT